MHARHLTRLAVPALALAIFAPHAGGFIHYPPPTLPKMCAQSMVIRELMVKEHSKEKGVVIFETTEVLKGKVAEGQELKHVLGKKTAKTKPVFEWLADGKRAVMFTIEAGKDGIACGYVFIDKFCYSVDRNGAGDMWLLIRADPEMAATFFGTVETLRKTTKDVLAGKAVEVPVDKSVKAVSNEERRERLPALGEVMKKNREK